MWAPIVVRGCIQGAVSRRDTLDAAFDNAIFYHAATTFSTDIFTNVAQSVSYNEPDNVTCVECSWAVHSPWHYPWKRRIAPAPSPPTPSPGTTCTAVNKTANEDIQGNDLPETPTFASTFDACLALCCANPACAALLWEARSDWAEKSCTKGAGCCWLKSAAGNRQPKPASVGAINANIDGRHPTPGGQPTLAEVAAPPLGYRSSPALGGVGAGSTELRSDGSFRDWTIFNQGPAGSGKYGLVDDVYMGVKVGKSAKMLRTLPPRWARNVGVDALTFSGTYPLTRLVANDSAFAATPTTLYAYSTLKPTDLAASAFPALVLTLHVVNPSPTAALNASFMFSLPFGAWTDCARSGVDGIVASAAASPAHCMHACGEASANCSAWEFDDAAALCTLHAEVPHTAHKVGAHCGVRSADGWLRTAKGGLVRSQRPLASGPSMGDITWVPSRPLQVHCAASSFSPHPSHLSSSIVFPRHPPVSQAPARCRWLFICDHHRERWCERRPSRALARLCGKRTLHPSQRASRGWNRRRARRRGGLHRHRRRTQCDPLHRLFVALSGESCFSVLFRTTVTSLRWHT